MRLFMATDLARVGETALKNVPGQTCLQAWCPHNGLKKYYLSSNSLITIPSLTSPNSTILQNSSSRNLINDQRTSLLKPTLSASLCLVNLLVNAALYVILIV